MAEKRVRRLIADLDDEQFATREAASRELQGLDPLAEAALRRALEDKPSAQTRKQVEMLLGILRVSGQAAEGLRAARSVRVLELIGTPEARKTLRTLSGGASPAPLTLDAKAALRRLEQR